MSQKNDCARLEFAGLICPMRKTMNLSMLNSQTFFVLERRATIVLVGISQHLLSNAKSNDFVDINSQKTALHRKLRIHLVWISQNRLFQLGKAMILSKLNSQK